jgi:hypothetical protein
LPVAAVLDWPKPGHVTATIQTVAAAIFKALIALLPARTRKNLEMRAKIRHNQKEQIGAPKSWSAWRTLAGK